MPPLEFQKDIVSEVQLKRASVMATRDAVSFQIGAIKAEIEAMILGTKKVEVQGGLPS